LRGHSGAGALVDVRSIADYYYLSRINCKSIVWWELADGARAGTLADQGKSNIRTLKTEGHTTPASKINGGQWQDLQIYSDILQRRC
jgi:hypothetical protein